MTKASRQSPDSPLVERWQLIGRAARDEGLSRSDLAVLHAILDRMYGGKRECSAGLNDIATRSGVSRPQVTRSIRRLTERGHLIRSSGAAARKVNTYHVPDATRCEVAPSTRCEIAPSTRCESRTSLGADRASSLGANLHPESVLEAISDRKQGQSTTSAVRCLLADRGFNVGSSRSYIERFVAAGGTASVLADYLAMPDAHGKPANWTLAWATRELTQLAAPINASAGGKTLQAIHALEAFRQPRVGLADRWPAMDAIDADCIALESDQAGVVRK